MDKSPRVRRLQRRHAAKPSASLHLVSLMDIFTILVFFMLVNATDFQDIDTRNVALPESLAEERPRETMVISITDQDILLQGETVGTVAAVLSDANGTFQPLRQALAGRAPQGAGPDKGEITIMGDKAIPYRLLRKVIATTTEAGYSRVSLAVIQKPQ